MLRVWFHGSGAYDEDSGTGEGNWDRVRPGEVGEQLVSTAGLRGSDKESQPAERSNEPTSNGEGGVEAFDGAHGDGAGGGTGISFGTASHYIDVSQGNGAANFAKESGFLLIGFDKSDVKVRSPQLDGNPWEAGTRAEVEQAGKICCFLDPRFRKRGETWGTRVGARVLWGEEMEGGEKGFAEMAGDNFFRIADGGEIDARVPAEK